MAAALFSALYFAMAVLENQHAEPNGNEPVEGPETYLWRERPLFGSGRDFCLARRRISSSSVSPTEPFPGCAEAVQLFSFTQLR